LIWRRSVLRDSAIGEITLDVLSIEGAGEGLRPPGQWSKALGLKEEDALSGQIAALNAAEQDDMAEAAESGEVEPALQSWSPRYRAA